MCEFEKALLPRRHLFPTGSDLWKVLCENTLLKDTCYFQKKKGLTRFSLSCSPHFIVFFFFFNN